MLYYQTFNKSSLMQEGQFSSSSEDNYLVDHQSSESIHKPKKTQKKDVKTQQTVQGKWTEEQSVKFALYIDQFPTIFSSKEKRKASKIFVSLSEYLGSRTPRQCRSHFQKLISKFKRINKIRGYYESILGPLEYARRNQQMRAFIKNKEAEKQPPLKTFASFQVQTQPMLLKISDLCKAELSHLMSLLQGQLKSTAAPAQNQSFPQIISLSDDNETDLIKKEPSE